MANYADFDKDAFFAALTDMSLKITDGDFGVEEEERQKQVTDAIFAALAKSADTDNQVKTGVIGKYDVLYYCYYATYTDDAGTEHVFFANKMSQSSSANFQLGLSSLEGLNLEIAKAVADKDITDYIYSVNLKGEDGKASVTKEGDVVYVSYTKEYSQLAYNEDGTPTVGDDGNQISETKKVTVSYERVTVGGAEGTFGQKLLGLEVGKTNSFELTNNALDSADKKESYTNVKVEWIVDKENEIAAVTYKPYTSDKEEANVYGDKVQLKDKELTYHIFPLYVIEVEDELTGAVVVDKFYSQLASSTTEDDVKTYKFDSVQNGGYKNGENTLATLVDELAQLRVTLSDAEKALTDAEKALSDAGDKKTEAQETAVAEAKTKVTEAKTKVDEKEAEILAATNAEGKTPDEAFVADMRAYQYDTLLSSYKSAVKQSLATEIFALANSKITFKKAEGTGYPVLPQKAVNEAYKRIENGHKYDFYEGSYTSSSSSSTSSSSSESNYKHYEGDYNQFLKVEYFGVEGAKTATMQDVYNKIGAAAEQAVRDVITVYVIANAVEEKYSTDLTVTDEQIDEFKLTYLYYYFGNSMVESDYVTALLCDNIFNYLLTETEEADYVTDEKYGENKVQYTNIKYDFKD